MYAPHVERRYVTRKRMERRAPDGQLISVTNTRTVHFNSPDHPTNYGSMESFGKPETVPPPLPPPHRIRHRSHSVSPRYNTETMKRSSVEYVDPPFVRNESSYIRSEPPFERYSREDEYHKLQMIRTAPSPRRRHEVVTWRREEAEPVYETMEWDRPEQIYFGRDDGTSPLNTVLNRINSIRKSNGKRELLPCPRLAVQAGQWAEWIVKNGEFRRNINEKMCIWRGNRVTSTIVDSWYEEAMEYRTSNYINMDWLRVVGAGSAYWPEKQQTVVVVIYD